MTDLVCLEVLLPFPVLLHTFHRSNISDDSYKKKKKTKKPFRRNSKTQKKPSKKKIDDYVRTLREKIN
jgi:hypothetical protein